MQGLLKPTQTCGQTTQSRTENQNLTQPSDLAATENKHWYTVRLGLLTIYRDEGNRMEQVLVLIYFNLFTVVAVSAQLRRYGLRHHKCILVCKQC
jgi:hypothetical protein